MPPSISPTTQASHNPVEDNVYSLTELYHRAEALNNKGKLADLANLLLLGMERGVPFKLEIDGSMASEPAMAEVQRYYGNIIGVSQIICVTGVDLILETAYTTFEGLENEVHVSFTPPSHTVRLTSLSLCGLLCLTPFPGPHTASYHPSHAVCQISSEQ